METLYAEISDVLDNLKEKCKSFGGEWSETCELQDRIVELNDLLKKERNDYNVCAYCMYHSFNRFLSLQNLVKTM